MEPHGRDGSRSYHRRRQNESPPHLPGELTTAQHEALDSASAAAANGGSGGAYHNHYHHHDVPIALTRAGSGGGGGSSGGPGSVGGQAAHAGTGICSSQGGGAAHGGGAGGKGTLRHAVRVACALVAAGQRRALMYVVGAVLAAALLSVLLMSQHLGHLPSSSSASSSSSLAAGDASGSHHVSSSHHVSGSHLVSASSRDASDAAASQQEQQRRSEDLLPPLDVNCPYFYRRHSLAEVYSTQEPARPYLLGGARAPECRNCGLDVLWSNFCSFYSNGPTCQEWQQWQILEHFKSRNLTSLLTLTPCDLWPWLRSRTVFIVGDSQGLDFYKALKCFMSEFWDVTVEVDPPLTQDPALQEVLTHNHVPPTCVHLPRNSRICFLRADRGDDHLVANVLPALHKIAKRHDLLLINFGLWHKDPKDYGWALSMFESFYRVFKRCLPLVMWKDTSQQHFDTEWGEFPGSQDADFVCAAPRHVALQSDGSLGPTPGADPVAGGLYMEGGWRNKMATRVMRSLGIPVVSSWNESVAMWQYHRSNENGQYECTHHCHPSAPQLWVWELYRSLHANRRHVSDFLAHESAIPTAPECALLEAPDAFNPWAPLQKAVETITGQASAVDSRDIPDLPPLINQPKEQQPDKQQQQAAEQQQQQAGEQQQTAEQQEQAAEQQ